jgi:prepilin-type N-terminal cleavage/methylation domain-containing protein
MKSALKANRGLTLIEIILALAILSIVLVAFLALFTNGFITIISMGNKSRAGVEAQEIADRIYAEAVISSEANLRQSISTILEEVAPSDYEDYTDKQADFDEANTDTKIRFYVTASQSMLVQQDSVFVVTLRVYYHNYARSVTISTPIVR